MLTRAPQQDVVVNVVPQATPTYDSSQAFNASANFGINNDVQVRVRTPQATFLFAGMPAEGETWTVLLDDRPYSYTVAHGNTNPSCGSTRTVYSPAGTGVKPQRL